MMRGVLGVLWEAAGEARPIILGDGIRGLWVTSGSATDGTGHERKQRGGLSHGPRLAGEDQPPYPPADQPLGTIKKND